MGVNTGINSGYNTRSTIKSGGGGGIMGSMPWTALIQMVNEAGESSRGRREVYDSSTGKFVDPKAVKGGYNLASVFAPHKFIGDPDVKGIDAFYNVLGLSWLSSLSGGAERYKKNKEERLGAITDKAHALFDNAPKYEIPQEAKDIIDSTKSGAGKARELASEAVDVSKNMTNSNVPGYGIIKENIMSSGANVANEAIQSGGIKSVGGMAEIHASTTASLQKLSAANMAYRAQKSNELKNTLGKSAQTEVGASNLEVAGLASMVDQKEQEFQINVMDPRYNKLQYDLMQLGNQMASQTSGGMLGGMI